PSSVGRGRGWGSELGDVSSTTTTPLPNPPPQGGREQSEQVAPPSPTAAPIRPIAYAEPHVLREDRPDGAMVLRAATPLAPYDPSLARLFRAAVERAPSRVFLAERVAGGWRKLTYAQARTTVDSLAQALIERGLDAERPVMILSGN